MSGDNPGEEEVFDEELEDEPPPMISAPSSPTNESFQDAPQSSESQYFPETRSILDDPNDFTNFDYETQDWKATIGDMDRARHLPPLRSLCYLNHLISSYRSYKYRVPALILESKIMTFHDYS